MTKSPDRALHKHIRILPQQWQRVARASLFAAQAIARDLIAAGRENEIQEIRNFISTIVPEAKTDGRF